MPPSRSLVVLIVPFLFAADPTPVEKQLAIRRPCCRLGNSSTQNKPAEAVAAAQVEIANADGNKAFLTLLRESYLAELARMEKETTPDAPRAAQLRRHLALLGGATPAAPAPASTPAPLPMPSIPQPSLDAPTITPVAAPPAAGAESVAEASAEFKKGNYAIAAKLFAANVANLAADQKAAWAYCRVKIAADEVNSAKGDAALAIAEVTDALKLAPQNAELQRIGQQVIAAANAKAKASPGRQPGVDPDAVETASFRVRHSGNRDLAENIAKLAEALRKETFERWSGPPSGAWSVKCEIVIHSTAEAFAKATGRPAGSTGNAIVRLAGGRAEERRIDLRADDAAIASNALPRELTHVVLADLFPDKPAPKWAVEGMAILAGSPDEAGRYTRTLQRCARDGEWFGLAQLMEMKDFPSDKITAFYCESVVLTEYLVRAAGSERNFTISLRDCQRYGTAQALKRQYNSDGAQALEAGWRRSASEQSR